MKYKVQVLKQENAIEIADRWKYPGVYTFYNMTEDPEDYEEFISKENRNMGNYFEVLNSKGELIGFFTLEKKEKNILEIGLGMKPELTGKGKGVDFFTNIINYLASNFEYKAIDLSVASFNIRAMKVYKKVGFQERYTFKMKSNDGEYEFVSMRLLK